MPARALAGRLSIVLAGIALLGTLACAANSPGIAGGQAVASATQWLVSGRVTVQGRETHEGVAVWATKLSGEVTAEVVAEGLEVPWALDFAPDGRIFITERSGRVRIVRDGVLQKEPFAIVDVANVSESGLMGLALHPQFEANGHLFVCYTYKAPSGQLRNRVARLTDVRGIGSGHRVILDDIPAARNHDGCRLGFGPDGKLYVTMGDAQEPDQAQNLESLSGKILRLEADGSVPSDNPFSGSYVYTYGHRNPQGLDWHPETGDLFITEHGPNTDDEINILQPGVNYGWPNGLGVTGDPRYVDPIIAYTPTLALAGAAFYAGDRLPEEWKGNLLFANLKASHLRRIVLEPPNFRTVASQQVLFQDQFGRLRAVALSPDGYIYFTTSNRDGRGRPRPGDDKLLRLVRTTAEPPTASLTNGQGEFSLELAPGEYSLRWSLPGFLGVAQSIEVPSDSGLKLEDITLLAGDLDGDGDVDEEDSGLMGDAFALPPSQEPPADLNADGVVDVLDLALLGSNWGETKVSPGSP